ncbi:hypothetical protein [Bacillus sp. P14.5]|uniref:hypothetical protein n=1 Tax=Bacillus sp. P14.5 TaxID=1983400 RepID=UPI0013B04CD2|nr:hypothetical protein [Bacillus sp. P14.5]
MTGQTIVTIIYLAVSLIWLATKGRTLIERNSGYLIPIMVFGIGSGMLILGTNYSRGWAGIGAMTYGLLVTGISLIIFLIVFIFEEVKRRKG